MGKFYVGVLSLAFALTLSLISIFAYQQGVSCPPNVCDGLVMTGGFPFPWYTYHAHIPPKPDDWIRGQVDYLEFAKTYLVWFLISFVLAYTHDYLTVGRYDMEHYNP